MRLISFMVYIILFMRKPEASENVALRTDDKCMHHSGHCCARLPGERGGGVTMHLNHSTSRALGMATGARLHL